MLTTTRLLSQTGISLTRGLCSQPLQAPLSLHLISAHSGHLTTGNKLATRPPRGSSTTGLYAGSWPISSKHKPKVVLKSGSQEFSGLSQDGNQTHGQPQTFVKTQASCPPSPLQWKQAASPTGITANWAFRGHGRQGQKIPQADKEHLNCKERSVGAAWAEGT